MLVKATKRGFLKRLYTPGEQFDCPKEAFSKHWMEKVTDEQTDNAGSETETKQPTKAASVSGSKPTAKKTAKKSAKASSKKKTVGGE